MLCLCYFGGDYSVADIYMICGTGKWDYGWAFSFGLEIRHISEAYSHFIRFVFFVSSLLFLAPES